MTEPEQSQTGGTALVVAVKPIDLRPYKPPAGGAGALKSVVHELRQQTGVFKGFNLLLKMNQDGGFDCPGCAWPEPKVDKRSRFEFCENGAKALAAEATRKRADPAFFAQWSIEALRAQSNYWLEQQGRLTNPMYKAPGATHYKPVSWASAFETIAQVLNDLSSPDQAVFYTSGRTSNEAAFMYQLFVRSFGTNNLPDCSNMCHESSGAGLGESIGIGKGTVTLEDFEQADAIFVIGQNPGTNHPRMLTTLQDAARRGCDIVSVNPLIERGLKHFAHPQEPLALFGPGTAISSHYLQVRINGDAALLRGIAKTVLEMHQHDPEAGHIDESFIAHETFGFESYVNAVEKTPWPRIVEDSGIDEATIREVGALYARARRSIICWAMGLTQHENGVANVQEVVNVLLLRGNIGRPGAGACPVRGHSNVQGDRTMGIVETPSGTFLDAVENEFGIELPRNHGLDTVNAIRAMAEGDAKVFFAMGGNFVAAAPDTEFTARALGRCELTVQVSTKLNRGHLSTGEAALILPCLGRTELDLQTRGPQFVTCENSMGVVSRSQGQAKPASPHLKSEVGIIAGLAKVTLGTEIPVDWDGMAGDYDRIRDAISRCIPHFEQYNARVRAPGGFILPNSARNRDWRTASGKAQFSVNPLPCWTLGAGEYLMATLRSHDQYNTTIYGHDDRYRGIYGERRIIMMNAEDMSLAGLSNGVLVDITSHYQGQTRLAKAFKVVTQSLPRGCVATYFPEANPLVPIESVAYRSNTPTSKSVRVTLSISNEHRADS